MTREEAKQVFLDRGFVNGIFDGDKWRQSVVVISEWLQSNSDEDCISRKEAINVLKADGAEELFRSLGVYPWNAIAMLPSIQHFPSIQPKAKVAHWQNNACSNCGIYNASAYKNWCPNCGCQMTEEYDNE